MVVAISKRLDLSESLKMIESLSKNGKYYILPCRNNKTIVAVEVPGLDINDDSLKEEDDKIMEVINGKSEFIPDDLDTESDNAFTN